MRNGSINLPDKRKWAAIAQSNAAVAAIAALIFGFIAHLFGIVMILNNYDSIVAQPASYGTGITSGRWFLTILGDIVGKCGGNYSLSVVNGTLLILFLAISAGFLVSALRIRRKVSAILIGMLFAVFPSATSVMFSGTRPATMELQSCLPFWLRGFRKGRSTGFFCQRSSRRCLWEYTRRTSL